MERNKIETAIVLLVLVISPLAVQSTGLHSASAQSLQNNSLEVGYGPNSLFPISFGVPVFSYTDQMWIMSSYNVSLNVQLRYATYSGTYVYLPYQVIQSNTISLLYTFSGVAEKNWTLLVSGQSIAFSIPITYVSPGSIPAPNGRSMAYFSSNQLAVNFSYSDPNSYNSQACFLGGNSGNLSSATLPVPSNLGTGRVSVTPDINIDSAELASLGTFKPVIFWFELLYTYSYAQPNSTGLVSTQIETSKSTPILISNSPPTNSELVAVQNNAVLRPGRYTLRAFFDASGNISVSQTSVLMLGSNFTWVWLGGCYSASQNSPTSFTSQTSISESPNARPQSLFLMYDNEGVEFYSAFALNVTVGEVVFTTLPFNASFSNIGVFLVSNKEITSSAFVNGVMYLMCSQFPVNVGFNFTFAGQTFATSQTTIIGSTPPPSINIPLSGIVVNVTNNRLPVSGVNATLHRGSSILFNATTNRQGIATFYVPAGNYSVSATYLGANLSNSVLTTVSLNSTTVIQFSVLPVSRSSPPDYSTPLIIVLVIGAFGNVWIWRSLLRRKKQYL